MNPLDSYANKLLWFPWRFDEADRKIPYRLDGKTKGWQNPRGRGTRAQAQAAAERMSGKGGIGIILGEPTEAAGAILVGLDLEIAVSTLPVPWRAGLKAWSASSAHTRRYRRAAPG
jgi:hypothetical protein